MHETTHPGRYCGVLLSLMWLAVPAVAQQTAPVPVEVERLDRVTFAVIGDFGLDQGKPRSNPDESPVSDARENPQAAGVADLVASWKPDFVVTTGDNNYPRGEAATIDANIGKYYSPFIGNYRGRHGPGSATNRFFPVLGNHDWDAPEKGCRAYLDYFTLPGNERYYDFVWGPVHFFMLDSDGREPDGNRVGSRQHRWFAKVASASRSPFQVVVSHHPPHSSGQHGGLPTSDWNFRKHGIELVLSGHDHDYERIQRDGLTYIVNGSGGANLRARKKDQAQVAGSRVFHHQKHGAQQVEVNPVANRPGTWELVSRFVDIDGKEIDRFRILSTAPKK